MKFRIVLKSFDNDQINYASSHLTQALKNSVQNDDYKLSGVIALPTKIKKFCVLRSPHVDKDSREHFEVRIYKRFLDLQTNSPAILDLLLKTELPSGISCSLKILTNA
jgi:small subunit ribosomal protein S10